MPVVLLVLVGGCTGGLARYALTAVAPDGWALLAANVLGAFALGALAGVRSVRLRALLGTGFCGAFTTMSAVAVAQDAGVLVAHGGLGLLAAAAGARVVR